MIEISKSAKISSFADIEDSNRGSLIRIGDNSVLDSFVKIKPAGGIGDVVIGSSTFINSGTVIYSGNGVLIGDNVSVAANCTFAPTNHAYLSKDKLIQHQGFLPSKGGIKVEDDVWIGANCVLLDGAQIGRGAVVAAGSLIMGVLEPYSVYSGSPLRKVKSRV